MKKIILAGALIGVALLADTKTITPYLGAISYDSSTAKSLKDSAKLGGFYTSIGNLNYLFELSYTYLNINYKSGALENLKQHDIVAKYGKYTKNYAISGGLHYINNNEKNTFKDLGDGFTAIIGAEAYKWYNYNKLSYGVDVYYSRYADAHTDSSLASTTTVDLWQFTPKLSFSKAINVNTRNTVSAKINYIKANDYKTSSYTSYELSDTLGYKSFFATLKYNGGKMRSGVKDGGMTVYNTKDLLRNAYSATLGYYFTPTLEASIAYSRNNYEEYDAATLSLLPEGTSSTALISLSYTY